MTKVYTTWFKMTMQYRPHEITTNDLLTWQVLFAKDGTLPPEAQRRLLEAQVRRDFNSHNGPIVVPTTTKD